MKKESQSKKSGKIEVVRRKALKELLKRKQAKSTVSAKTELERSLKQYSELVIDVAKQVAKTKGRKRLTDEDIFEAKSMLLYPGKSKE